MLTHKRAWLIRLFWLNLKISGVQREVSVQLRFSYIANFSASPRYFSLVRGIAVYCNIF